MSTENARRVFGIDLGTTYSALAFVDEHGKAQIIPNSDNENITPSVVFFEEGTGNVIVGSVARESARTDPQRVVTFVKRHMGEAGWVFSLDGKDYSPERVSSLILKRLADNAQTFGHDVKDVVITCPAYFKDAERNATRTAGQMAGLNVLDIIDEPVAAAYNYSLGNADNVGKTAIVYDLGGGTFDVTVIRVTQSNDGGITVESVWTLGDHKLGGKNWDDRLVDYLIREYQQLNPGKGDDIRTDRETMFELQVTAENVKKTLSKRETAMASVTHAGERTRVDVTRKIFDEITSDLLEQTVTFTRDLIEQVKKEKGIARFDDFLLVGGSTRMPQVMEMVKREFQPLLGVEPREHDVDQAVAQGAALHGNILHTKKAVEDTIQVIRNKTGNEGKTDAEIKDEAFGLIADETGQSVEEVVQAVNTRVITVASGSYGLRAVRKSDNAAVINNLIFRQTPLPASAQKFYGVDTDKAANIEIIIFVNDSRESAADLDSGSEVGRGTLKLEAGRTKDDKVEVTFTLNPDGTLSVKAVDRKSGNDVKLDIKAATSVSEEEIAQAQAENASLTIE